MPRVGLTPASVLDAAERIADAEGPDAVTLARLAAELSVRPPSLYKHVDGLEAVRRGLALRGIAEANRRLQLATIGKARDDALHALADAYWRFARERPGLYAASLRAARPGENDVAAAGDAFLGIVLAVLSGYGVTGDDALHATRGLRAIIHGFVSLDAAGGFRLKLDLEESLRRLLAAFARDLAERGRNQPVEVFAGR
jgi:AcrR family transcriptional regulator